VIHVITWTTTHLPTPKGWKAELAWLVEQQQKPSPTKWSRHPQFTESPPARRTF